MYFPHGVILAKSMFERTLYEADKSEILSNILLSRMTPYANEIIGEYQCGFRRNRSTVDHIFSIRQMLEKKWEYNKDVCQLFIDFEKAL